MPHSPELIASILKLVEADYPPSVYRYEIERPIPGTKMSPDILVWSGGRIQCAVEIGYTRPEKLTAYRTKHKIPDVRWYDKAGNLHADVEERVVRATVRVEPAHEFSVYSIRQEVTCADPGCVEEAECEAAGGDMEDFWESLTLEVLTTVVTDWDHAWFPSFCDKCGEHWLASECDAEVLIDALDCRPMDFGRAWGARLFKGSWQDACRYVDAVHGLSLEYQNGIAITDHSKLSLHRDVLVARDRLISRPEAA